MRLLFHSLQPQAELRVETFMQEKSTKLNQKVSRLNAQLSASALDYEKEVAALKAEARNRFTSLKLRLQEVTVKKEEVRQAPFVDCGVGQIRHSSAQAVLGLSSLCGVLLCICLGWCVCG